MKEIKEENSKEKERLSFEEALNELDDYPFELSKVYKERRELVVEHLKELDFTIQESDATMFVWAKLPERFNKDSLKFSLEYLRCGNRHLDNILR